jgi:hypothetical protein
MHVVLESLAPAERVRVDEIIAAMREDRRALRQSRFTASWLADVFSDHGHPIGQLSVQNHIAARCRCGY